jgi:hypothetical protein
MVATVLLALLLLLLLKAHAALTPGVSALRKLKRVGNSGGAISGIALEELLLAAALAARACLPLASYARANLGRP